MHASSLPLPGDLFFCVLCGFSLRSLRSKAFHDEEQCHWTTSILARHKMKCFVEFLCVLCGCSLRSLRLKALPDVDAQRLKVLQGVQ
jgi:hypothetical protein